MKKITTVPPEGDISNCILAFVGEQPGKTEVFRRRPFIGPAGMALDSCFASATVPRFQCYLTNVIKDLDRPLNEYIKFGKTGVVLSEDGTEYLEILKNELSSCSANVIVAIGNVALYALTGRRGITNWHGSVIESNLIPGKKIIPILHPATIIPPKNVYLNRRLIIFDLIRAMKEAEFPEIKQEHRNIVIEPSYYDTLAFLELCYSKGKDGELIVFDIEVYNNQVSCISFAYSPTEAMSIPFIDSSGDYFTIEQEVNIWQAIALILEDPKIIKGGQNLGFDSTILLSHFGIKTHNIIDTMVAQKILFPDYPVGLDFITTTYTDVPYYKGEGKKWFRVGGVWKTLWHYNGMDSIVPAIAYPRQVNDLTTQGNIETCLRQTRIIEPLVYMMVRGIRVDTIGMLNAKTDMDKRIAEAQLQLDTLAGQSINANSPNQLKWYFYEHLGHKPYMKKGHVTTDETALVRLLRKGVKEAGYVKEIRSLRKLSSTYTNIDKIDPDGRIRCSYNPAGTKTGRLSSSENIFGTGMNLQNWPHPLMKYLLPDEGYIYYSLDLSQIENRIVAYVGRVPRMIDAFESGKDVHRLTASLIFNKPVEEISDEDGSSSLGTGAFSERFWGKKSNHSFNYDLGYRKFALSMEMAETEAKWIVNRYHSIYPEVRGNYHQMVRSRLAKDRTLTNLFGRKRAFLGKWEDELFKQAYAQIPQSTTADKINEQGLSYVYYNQDKFEEVEFLNQIHDSIGFQIPLSSPWTKHAEILMDIKKSLETPLTWESTTFVVPVDIFMGLNFYEAEGKEFKHGRLPTSVEEFAKELEKTYVLLKG